MSDKLVLLRRIARLRDAIEHVIGQPFVENYTPRYKRGEPRPESLPVPSATVWIAEVLAGDDALSVGAPWGRGSPMSARELEELLLAADRATRYGRHEQGWLAITPERAKVLADWIDAMRVAAPPPGPESPALLAVANRLLWALDAVFAKADDDREPAEYDAVYEELDAARVALRDALTGVRPPPGEPPQEMPDA